MGTIEEKLWRRQPKAQMHQTGTKLKFSLSDVDYDRLLQYFFDFVICYDFDDPNVNAFHILLFLQSTANRFELYRRTCSSERRL